MVYRGKPSAACAECRKLRSRCDKKLPACGQCIKAGRGCSGYRNVVDLMFLDESSRVVTQNKRRVPSKQTALNKYKASTDLYEQAKSRESSETPFHLAGFVMYQPLDHLGVTYFMSNFVVDDPNMSLIYYLPNLYAKTGFSDPALWQMCAAVGLVSLANKSQREDMFNVATDNYSAAIRSINSALLCPKKAAQDSILASIFMAAMFEALIIPRNRGMDNCCTHLAGAVSVAHLILKQGMETDVTMQQCTALVKTVIMNCWVQDIALPPHFAEFKRLVETKAAHVSIHDVFLDINMELLHFKKEYQYSTKHSPAVIIEKALEVDATLEEFERKMECQIPFETIQSSTVGEELAYNGYFHVYPQHLHAHLWNNVRASRVRLHQVILRQSQSLEPSPSITSQQKTSIATAISQTAEMLASIPQLAGYLQDLGLTFIPPGEHHESPTGYPAAQHTTSIPIPEYNFHSLCHILYQLYIYGSEPCLPQKMRDWIQQRISWMEHHANPIDLAGLQETVRRQIWPVSLVDKEELRNATFQNEANALLSNIEAASQRDGTTAAVGFRLGGNDFLHRQAVSAGGMHSCSSVACKICDV